MSKKYIIISTIFSGSGYNSQFNYRSFPNTNVAIPDYHSNNITGISVEDLNFKSDNKFIGLYNDFSSNLEALESPVQAVFKASLYNLHAVSGNLDQYNDKIQSYYSPSSLLGMTAKFALDVITSVTSPGSITSKLDYLDNLRYALQNDGLFTYTPLPNLLNGFVQDFRSIQKENPYAVREIVLGSIAVSAGDVMGMQQAYKISEYGKLGEKIGDALAWVGRVPIYAKGAFDFIFTASVLTGEYKKNPHFSESQKVIIQTSPDSYKNKHGDPFIFDLSGNNKIDLIGLPESTVLFDMDGDGLLNRTAWVKNGDGILVIDKNGNGKIDDVTELLETQGSEASHALENLRKQFDSNLDSKITAADSRFGELRVWIDTNTNGITDAGELKTLSELNITQINLNSATVSIEDEHGNITQGITSATRNNTNILAEEVALLVNTTDFSLDKTENGINYYTGADGSVLGVAADAAAKTVDLSTSKIDAFIGNSGNDTLSTTGKESVAIDGGAGNDTITGGEGDDILVGGDGVDSLRGGRGDDTLFIDSADTTIDGGEGSDTIFINTNTGMSFDAGSHNVEAVFGGDGADSINTSTAGAVTFFGGEGNDTLFGNAGDDICDGGAGNDNINGNAGMDTAIYSGKKSDYTVSKNTDNTWAVTDSRASVDGVINSGTDILTNIERIRFDDEVVHADTSAQNPSGTNNNPIVVGGKMEVRNLDALTITSAELLGTATDKDGDYLSVAGIGKVIGGLAALDKAGNVIFKPREGFSGKASFEYTVDDGNGGRATGTAEIEVKPDLPADKKVILKTHQIMSGVWFANDNFSVVEVRRAA